VRITSGSAAICLTLLNLPVSAHHSHGSYQDAFIDLTGEVKEVHLLVPHSFVYVEVKPANGEPQMWTLEATSRSGLERIGVTAGYLKVGDTVKARCHALRDGSAGCLLRFLKTKDGSVKDWDGGNLPAPTDF
jgi:hypothetical protein